VNFRLHADPSAGVSSAMLTALGLHPAGAGEDVDVLLVDPAQAGAPEAAAAASARGAWVIGLVSDAAARVAARALGCHDELPVPPDPVALEARIHTARASARQQARWRAMAEASTEGLVVHEAGVAQLYNATFGRMFGYDATELVGQHVRVIHPAELVTADLHRGDAENDHGELPAVRKDGSKIVVHARGAWVQVPGGRYRVGSARDVSEERRAEQALRESNARFELVARATNDAVYDWTIATGAIVWNDAFHTLFGYTGDPARADVDWWAQNLHPDDSDRVSRSLEAAIAAGQEAWSAEYRFGRADGSWAEVLDRGLVLRDASGAAVRMIGVMADITAINQMRANLVLADRMASMGTLAAGVAHEINNPLTFVMAKVSLADEALAPAANHPGVRAARESLAHASDGLARIRAIVKDLKLFSRAEEESHLAVDVRRVVESALSIANAELKQRARVVRAFRDTPRVDANEARLGQVILNLVVNAAQAIPPGNPDGNTITVTTGVSADGRVVVEVKDTGGGIPAGLRARIFDPFFTTKPAGEGTGLGLAISRQLLAQMGGEIDVESEEGHGSTFRVHLPPVPVELDHTPADLPSHLESGPRRGRVLIVDDEQMIVSFLERVVELEHDVETCTDPRQALARLLGEDTWDVVLCDLMMPELTGQDIWTALSKANPELARRVIFITGGAFTPRVRAFLEETRVLVLEKPFDIRALRDLLRERVAAIPAPPAAPAGS